jgi:hypothetical protein
VKGVSIHSRSSANNIPYPVFAIFVCEGREFKHDLLEKTKKYRRKPL